MARAELLTLVALAGRWTQDVSSFCPDPSRRVRHPLPQLQLHPSPRRVISLSHHRPPARSTALFSAVDETPNSGKNVSSKILGIDVDSISATSSASRIGGSPHRSLDDLPIHRSVSGDAGPLWKEELCDENSDLCTIIPHRGRFRKRVLVLCTGGTLTMCNDPAKGNSLAPVQGALTSYLAGMRELTDDPEMPEIISHEYKPLIDSSDMGPGDWAMLARDINANYYYFDGFVILMGTDTMGYAASALSFMLQNLGKPVIFTGSQIPLREPYNDARKNLIMATIFASSDSISEVAVFFHDRLVRGCRATKVNTSKLKAFDSPNLPPLAEIGINIEENYHLFRPPPRGSFKINTSMDTRMTVIRLVPGFDDASIKAMIDAARETHLKGLILQLYGTGNLPSLKDDLIDCLKNATTAGVVVVATTQCQRGGVVMGHYATGQKLLGAGVVSRQRHDNRSNDDEAGVFAWEARFEHQRSARLDDRRFERRDDSRE